MRRLSNHHAFAFWLLLAVGVLPLQLRADDVLWNLDFDHLAPGAALKAEDRSTIAPQYVASDASNTLTGIKSFGGLTKSPLLFKKASTSTFCPRFELQRNPGKLVTSGVLTFSWDLLVDELHFDAKDPDSTALPIENLLSFTFMKVPGSYDHIITVLGTRDSSLSLGPLGEGESNRFTFAQGEVVKVRIVVDLNQHTLQLFVNDSPVGKPIYDDTKFASFFSMRFTDGTAIGGNLGSTFTAAFDNIKVTLK